MKYLKGIINKPPLCLVCGKPMSCEVHPAEESLDGTAVTQTIGWQCPKCYDPKGELWNF